MPELTRLTPQTRPLSWPERVSLRIGRLNVSQNAAAAEGAVMNVHGLVPGAVVAVATGPHTAPAATQSTAARWADFAGISVDSKIL